ncbi:MAG: hypothetical protein EKK41_11555 [Hyphomicrobiales bacterium]|nr:MAG: hypothetical protein EKK41_11555 [Hyphomicrobiales bacterium]
MSRHAAGRASSATMKLWAAAALLAGLDALVAWLQMVKAFPLYMAAMFVCLAMALWVHRERTRDSAW